MRGRVRISLISIRSTEAVYQSHLNSNNKKLLEHSHRCTATISSPTIYTNPICAFMGNVEKKETRTGGNTAACWVSLVAARLPLSASLLPQPPPLSRYYNNQETVYYLPILQGLHFHTPCRTPRPPPAISLHTVEVREAAKATRLRPRGSFLFSLFSPLFFYGLFFFFFWLIPGITRAARATDKGRNFLTKLICTLHKKQRLYLIRFH